MTRFGEKYGSVLFLSCDVVGSTAYKQSTQGNSSSQPWPVAFLTFYQTYPVLLAEMQNSLGCQELELELWKPIGDELIFTCPVASEEQIFQAVTVWLQAMKEYSENHLEKIGLGVKGGAFIATFPGPDSIASIPRTPQPLKTDIGAVARNDEVLQRDDAHDDYLYDYFGPSIDTGFRILGECTARYFTLSAEVAFVLASLAHNNWSKGEMSIKGLIYRESVPLKGVWGGREYPIFAIDRDYEDDVNAATRALGAGRDEPEKILNLATACRRDPEWKFHLYLPKADDPTLRKEPKDALAEFREKKSELPIVVDAEPVERKGSEVDGASYAPVS